MAAKTRENWPWFLGVASATALLLAVGFSILISRPLRNIDRSIRKLGRGEFNESILINGPRDLRSLGERLDWLRRRLLELETHQSRFLRHVSHELKTPLTAVREGSELLKDRIVGEMSPQQNDVVRIIRDNTLSLQRLIEDLLSYQQHKSAAPLKVEKIDIKAIIERVVREHRLEMLSRAISVDVHGDAITLQGDSEQLRVVLDNLLSNAIKYTPRGGNITVTVRREASHALAEVCDSGPGIPPERRDSVFERFHRDASVGAGAAHGAGLGLTIARSYARRNGGEIELDSADMPESATGGGLRAILRLPLHAF